MGNLGNLGNLGNFNRFSGFCGLFGRYWVFWVFLCFLVFSTVNFHIWGLGGLDLGFCVGLTGFGPRSGCVLVVLGCSSGLVCYRVWLLFGFSSDFYN